MRRHELSSTDAAVFDEVALGAEIGEVGLITTDGTPPRYACPATHFCKSVEIRGRCDLVDDLAEKAEALQALMEKYQPEGGHDPIRASDPVYAKALAGVAVFRVSGAWTAKVKFG